MLANSLSGLKSLKSLSSSRIKDEEIFEKIYLHVRTKSDYFYGYWGFGRGSKFELR